MQALKFSCLQQERQQELQLSVDEINRRREERLSMCQVRMIATCLLLELCAMIQHGMA